MDIITACEAEGYNLVTKNDNIYVFEDELNYVFVDTSQTIYADKFEHNTPYFEIKVEQLQHSCKYLHRDTSKVNDVFTDENIDEFTHNEKKMLVSEIESKVDNLAKINIETQIFVYNKVSGNVSHNNIFSVADKYGDTFDFEERSYSNCIGSLDMLPSLSKEEYEKKSAHRIIKHLDDLGFDIHALNSTGKAFDAFKSALGNKIHCNDIKPGMVISFYSNLYSESYDLFKIKEIQNQTSLYDLRGVNTIIEPVFHIEYDGDINNYSKLGAGVFTHQSEMELWDKSNYFQMDEKIIETAPLANKLSGAEHKVHPLDKESNISKMQKAVKDEICDGRNILPFWQV